MKERIIFIAGLPATGKTTKAEELIKEDSSYRLYSTDEFLGEEDFLWSCILNEEGKFIVEGTMATKLLLRGARTNLLTPDLIIHCMATSKERSSRFDQRGKNFSACSNLDRHLLQQWFEYIGMPNACKNIIEHITS